MSGEARLPAPDAPAETDLAALITRLGAGVDRFDEGFARDLARALDDAAGHIRLPCVDRLGLADVMCTLSMDRAMRLVVTGNLAEGDGLVTARWEEARFPEVRVALRPLPHEAPYTFGTLDFGPRGRRGLLAVAAPPLPAGQIVTIRALATIGATAEWRVRALGLDRTVPYEAVTLR